MSKHRNPRARLPKRPSPDNFDPGVLIALLYDDLVKVEALAVTAHEAVTQLPPRPPGKHQRTMALLYTLVGKTSGRAQGALERAKELVALHAATWRPGPPLRRLSCIERAHQPWDSPTYGRPGIAAVGAR